MQQTSLRMKDTVPQDLLGGIAVFLVALPLCLGIALASGAPLFSGIIAGIVGGIVIGIFSQSPLSVSGPAAGLSTFVLSSIQQLGEFRTFLMSVMLAGIFQIIFGILRLGKIADFIPSAVIRGMLAAIGLTLILKQLPHAVGYDQDYEGDESFLQDDGHNTLSEIFYSTIGPLSFSAIFICLVSIGILVLFQNNFIKSNRYLKFIPGPLVVVVFGIVANQIISNFIGIEAGLTENHLVKIPVSADFTSFLYQFNLPDFNAITSIAVWQIAITLALVASIESLLSLEAVDKLDSYKRVSPTNRELIAQGLGNLTSGLIGGLPVTSVIVRSSANVNSGAVNKTSTIAHGIYLLLAVIFIPFVINRIPLSCLAAILLYTGYKLAHPTVFRNKWIKGKAHFYPFVATIVAILFTNLLVGILIGLLFGLYFIVNENYKKALYITKDGNHYYIKSNKDLSFINKSLLKQTLFDIEDGADVIIDFAESKFIDLDNDEIIQDFIENSKYRNINVELRKAKK